MRVLVIGGTGLLGQALVKVWTGDELVCTGSLEADVRDRAQVEQLVKRHKPSWIVLAAAYTDVDGCEHDVAKARAVNVGGAKNVARAARSQQARLLLVSTDYVFDGSKTLPYEVRDVRRALNVYGQTKLEAEDAVQAELQGACVVRTSRLYGTEGRCFPATILSLARNGKELEVVDDQRACPTFNRDLATAIRGLVRAEAEGVHHAVNEGACSWYEFAHRILQIGGMDGVRIRPIRTEESHRAAVRPRHSALSNRSLEAYGIRMRPWQEALEEYMQEVQAIQVSR